MNRSRQSLGGTELRRPPRQFGRLSAVNGRVKPATAPASAPVEAAPELPPIDMPKAFLGPNGTYYDDRWRWMDWRGRNYGWNWAAATTFGGWLAYRRMYRLAAAYLAWLVLLLALVALGLPLLVAAGALVASATGLGVYGNTLYLRHFRRVAGEVGRRHAEFDQRVRALNRAGGVDRRAAWIMAGLILLACVAMLQANRWLFGELNLSL